MSPISHTLTVLPLTMLLIWSDTACDAQTQIAHENESSQITQRLIALGATVERTFDKSNMDYCYTVSLSASSIDETPIWIGSESDFAMLGRLQNIVDLSLIGVKVDDEELAAVLQGNQHLRKLTLFGAALSDASLESIGKLQYLQELDIVSGRVEGLSGLNACRSLVRLRIATGFGTPIPSDVVQACIELPALRNLTLVGKEIDVEGLNLIGPNRSLSEITLLSAVPLKPVDISLILSKCPAVREIKPSTK